MQKMKLFFAAWAVVFAGLSLGGAAYAEAPYGVAWSRQLGTSAYDWSNAVAVDVSGNAYISGHTEGSIGGPRVGQTDTFLSKYDVSGNLLWSKQIGTPSYDEGRAVAVDTVGNVYISGNTGGSLGGTNAGSDDAFLVKYDRSGNHLWSRQIGTGLSDSSKSVAVDVSGSVYISGFTSGSLGGTNAGANDAFLAKYDGSGNLLWSRQLGTSKYDQSLSVAVDAVGGVYISGGTEGSLGGTNAGGNDAFLAKYDASGNRLWSRQIGTSKWDLSESVAVDVFGSVYISGSTEGSLCGTNAGLLDAFLIKYDGLGNLLWSRQLGTSSYDDSHSVAVDAVGGVYISGQTGGSLGGPKVGETDAFLVKFDESGNLLWSQQLGTTLEDESYSVAVGGSGVVYISGSTKGSLGGTNAGYTDAFLVKFTPEPGSLSLLTLGGLALLRRRGRK